MVSFWSPQVFSYANIANVAQAAAPLVIMALGVLLVIITGGIDLSVGSTFSFSGMVAGLAMLHGAPWPVGCLVGLAVGLIIGAANGALVTYVGLAPFVVTLVTYAVGASLAFVITDGHSIALLNPTLYLLNSGHIIPGLSNFVLFCFVGVIVIEVGLRKVVLGRWVYAVGSNDRASRLLGIPVNGVRLGVYVIAGALAASASMLNLSYISNAEATSGANMMLQAIAACVIGGASLFGRHWFGDRGGSRRVDDRGHPERCRFDRRHLLLARLGHRPRDSRGDPHRSLDQDLRLSGARNWAHRPPSREKPKMTTTLKRGVSIAALAACAVIALTGAATAEDKKFTVAIIMPSLDISYWQWTNYGAKIEATELGMNYIELDSHDLPTEQMTDVRTAITKGANAIVMGPVSSTSTPPVLKFLKEQNIPIAFSGIGPQPGETDYTSSVTANNEDFGHGGSQVRLSARQGARRQ